MEVDSQLPLAEQHDQEVVGEFAALQALAGEAMQALAGEARTRASSVAVWLYAHVVPGERRTERGARLEAGSSGNGDCQQVGKICLVSYGELM